MPLLLEILPIQTIYQSIGHLGTFFLLEMLDDAVGVEGIGDGTAKLVGYARGGTVGGHEGGVEGHFFRGVAISGVFWRLRGREESWGNRRKVGERGDEVTWIFCTSCTCPRLLGWLRGRVGKGGIL